MPSQRRLFAGVLIVAGLAVPASASAQVLNRVEITPYGGWRWGGELSSDDNALFDEDVEIDESPTFGVRLDVALHPNVQLELLAARQSTEFTGDEELFGPARDLLDVDIDLYHVGALFQTDGGGVQPFGVVTVGLARLAPDLPGLDTEERLSFTAGGGVKVWMSQHVGFRFEGRFLWIDTEDDEDWDDDEWDDWDDWEYEDVYQGEVTAGLMIGF